MQTRRHYPQRLWYEFSQAVLACTTARKNFRRHGLPPSGGRTQQTDFSCCKTSAPAFPAQPLVRAHMAYMMDDLKIPRSSIKLEIGIFRSRTLDQELRDQIEKTLAITALDIYGLSEVMDLASPWSAVKGEAVCTSGKIFPSEIVEAENRPQTSLRRRGRTRFHQSYQRSLSVIRYRTGDLTRLYSEPCVCGRTMARMETSKSADR